MLGLGLGTSVPGGLSRGVAYARAGIGGGLERRTPGEKGGGDGG